MKRNAVAIAALGLILSACAAERSVEGYNEGVDFYEEVEAYSNIVTQDAHMFGDIGDMRNLDHPATVEGYDEGNFTTLEVNTQDSRGAAMHWLDITGGINHPALRPGNSFTFHGGNYPDDEGAIHIEAMACQGDQYGAWDYDEAASRTEVSVHEVDGRDDMVVVDYVTYLPGQNSVGFNDDVVSSGTFAIQR